MNLATPRLSLKELTASDVPLIHDFHCDPRVARFNTIGIPAELSVTEELMKPVLVDQRNEVRNIYSWVLRDINNNSFVGEAGMSVMNNRFQIGEIHYHILPELWGQGLATEVARELIRFGFEDLKLHRIQAGAATENVGSHRVLEKVGMTKEGLKRKVLPIRGEWYDNYSYAIIEDDPRP